MKCCKCTKEINPLRLKALPNTRTCVKCSTTSAWYVRNIIAGKTEYAETEIIKDAEAAGTIRKMDQRTGWGSNLYKGSIWQILQCVPEKDVVLKRVVIGLKLQLMSLDKLTLWGYPVKMKRVTIIGIDERKRTNSIRL